MKIQKFFKGLGLLIGQPSLINAVIEHSDPERKYVQKKYGLQQGLPVLDLETLCPQPMQEEVLYGSLGGGSTPMDVVLLCQLAKRNAVEKYLEIGTWRGESAINISPLVKECYTLNLSDEQLRKMNLPEDYIKAQACLIKPDSGIHVVRGHSAEFDFETLGPLFDMIFIDGDHHYEAVRRDTARLFPLLNKQSGVMVWHDYALHPEEVRWEVLAGILDGMPEEEHQHLYHVSNTLCAIWIPEKLMTKELRAYMQSTRLFRLAIKEGRDGA
jgi:predicted O-methyltransferase YrrM